MGAQLCRVPAAGLQGCLQAVSHMSCNAACDEVCRLRLHSPWELGVSRGCVSSGTQVFLLDESSPTRLLTYSSTRCEMGKEEAAFHLSVRKM